MNIPLTIAKYFDSLLLDQLTTYEGRIKAIKIKYSFIKQTPIYIDNSMCFVPIYNKKDIENIYVNVKSIKYLQKSSLGTKIIFIDNSIVNINKPIEIIRNYINKANMITKL